MFFIPTFKIGIWNAWMYMLILYAAAFVPQMIHNEKVEKRMEGEPKGSEQKKITRVTNTINHTILLPLTMILSIFLPIRLWTRWFYAGTIVYLSGVVMVLLYSIAFGTAALEEPLNKGVYAISRNPGYLGFFLAYLGTGIVCASWIFMVCALVWIVTWQFGIVEEEQILLQKYGVAYRLYMSRTPRWIGFPKKQ